MILQLSKTDMSDKKINVLHMVSWYFSIADRNPNGGFHTELAEGLSEFCNVAIYCPYERRMEEEFSCKEELGILTYRSKYKLEKKCRNRLYMYRTMKRIVREFKPDIIHGHVGTEAGRFAAVLGRLFSIPIIITEHSSTGLSGVQTFPHHQYAYLAYSLSRYNACVSDVLTSDLSEIFPRFEFHTIYNGIIIPDDMDEYMRDAADVRVPGVVNIVLVASMYDEHIKGIDILIPALKRVRDAGYDIAMHFVGDGPYRKAFEQMAEDNGVSDICIFHGRKQRKDVLAIVSQMDFLVSVSRFESFGCTMAEAVMMGTPILVTDSGGSRSIVNKDNGIMIEGYDEEAIADGIIRMIGEYEGFDPASFGPEAREKFNIRSIAKQYMDVYEKVLKT